MPRRRTSDLEAWIAPAARLPWWLALVLAVVSYWGLHTLAQVPPAPVANVQDMGTSVSSSMLRGLAVVGQYLVPAILILGAIASAAATYKRRALLSESKARAGTADLQELSWQDFERLVGQAFRERGYQVAEAPPGPDGGVDLALRKDGELHLVQCKRWRAQKVGVEIVRELYGVMSARGAAGGYVITSGDFTPEARRFAHGRNIELWNGPRLKAAIRGVQAKAPAPASQGAPAATSTPPSPALACPICGASMVKRTARKGPNAGQVFWGCTRFPTCRGTRVVTAP
jgi:restriction system protein